MKFMHLGHRLTRLFARNMAYPCQMTTKGGHVLCVVFHPEGEGPQIHQQATNSGRKPLRVNSAQGDAGLPIVF